MKAAIILLALTCVLAAPVEEDDALEEFVKGNRVFSSAIYKEIVKQNPGNLIVSPFSVETVLALTYEGAGGATAAELVAGLSLPSTKAKVERAFKSFLPKLKTGASENLKVNVANKIYVENGVKLDDKFRSVAVDVYGSGVENVNFEDSVDTAAEINEWVEEQTNHRIKNLITPDALQEETAIVLINALYLYGKWAVPFHEGVQEEFYTSKKDQVLTDTIHSEGYFLYYENKELDATFLELPLQGGDVRLVVVLPNQIDGLANLEENIDQVLEPQPLKSQFVSVELPTFTTESLISFAPVLKSLGIERLFDPNRADLRGLSPNVNVYVQDVTQKAFIAITEGGLEAAAATSVIVGITSVGVDVPIPFKADHPFLYYIKDDGLILFSGRFVQP